MAFYFRYHSGPAFRVRIDHPFNAEAFFNPAPSKEAALSGFIGINFSTKRSCNCLIQGSGITRRHTQPAFPMI
ncbi:hypothetical protein [Spiribacter roseus]|uniref:Uncharacterized protein n=1 Tax=Spiribacter roseus TaxID=1855875 RepID=A0ABV3RZX3_9GAMM